jgi:hypothetical protein
VIVIGIRHALLCLRHQNPDSTSIREVSEACVMPDPKPRSTISGVASDADSLGLLSDAAIASAEALNGDTDKARPIRREETHSPDEAHQTRRFFLRGSAQGLRPAHTEARSDRQVGFSSLDETSCERCVLPLADIPKATIYRWKGKESRTRINAGDRYVRYKAPPSPSHEM